jgi:hypothetical protein
LKFYHKYILKDCPTREESPDLQYGQYVHEAIENFIKSGQELPPGLTKIAEVVEALKQGSVSMLAEPPLALDKNWEPCAPTDWDRAWLRAKIDLLIRFTRGAMHVDWKTGKPSNSEEMQLYISSALLFQWYPHLDVIEACFFYTKTMKRSDTVTLRREQAPAILKSISKQAGYIEYRIMQGMWDPSPGHLCRFCEVARDQCDHRR